MDLPNLQELRDIVVVVYGVLGILLFLVLIIVGIVTLFAVRGLSRTVRDLIADPVRPTLSEAREAMHTIRGTTEYIADATVHPFIRVVAVARGVRRGLGVISGVTRRRR